MSGANVNLLSEKLLQGWTLLAESCPVCSVPLVKDRQGNTMCVQCKAGSAESAANSSPNENFDDVRARLYGTQLATPSSAVSAVLSSSSTEKATTSSSKTGASAKIAEKLLHGWTLLGDSCPQPGCHVPLMRDTNMNRHCVACGITLNPSGKIISGGKSAATPTKSFETAPETVSSSNNIISSFVSESRQGGITDRAVVLPVAATASSSSASSSSSARLGVNELCVSETSRSTAKDSTLSVLYGKLDTIRRLLHSCDDLEQSRSLCAFISEISTAIANVEKLQMK